jgi:hypothetical protein
MTRISRQIDGLFRDDLRLASTWAEGIQATDLFYAGLGFVPISSLCMALVGICPLHLSTVLFVFPMFVLGAVIAKFKPEAARRAVLGLAAGILAVAVYDALRLCLVASGMWEDFVPTIGKLALHNPAAHPVWGYLWRFLLNGGGMGITFAILPFRTIKSGIVYGLSVCCCLLATLLLSANAQRLLFPLTVPHILFAIVGHIAYGTTLGWSMRHLDPVHPAAQSFEATRDDATYDPSDMAIAVASAAIQLRARLDARCYSTSWGISAAAA